MKSLKFIIPVVLALVAIAIAISNRCAINHLQDNNSTEQNNLKENEEKFKEGKLNISIDKQADFSAELLEEVPPEIKAGVLCSYNVKLINHGETSIVLTAYSTILENCNCSYDYHNNPNGLYVDNFTKCDFPILIPPNTSKTLILKFRNDVSKELERFIASKYRYNNSFSFDSLVNTAKAQKNIDTYFQKARNFDNKDIQLILETEHTDYVTYADWYINENLRSNN